MGVTHRGDPMCTRIGRPGKTFGQCGAPGGGGAGDVVGVDGVEHALQGAQDVEPARQVEPQFVHEPGQCPDVLLQFPDRQITLREVDATQPVQRILAGGGGIPERGGGDEIAAEIGVGRRLDIEVDVFTGFQRHEGVERRDSLHQRAVGAVNEPFGVESGTAGEAELDPKFGGVPVTGGPVGRRSAGHMQPHRRPRGAPRCALGDRGERVLHRFGERDGLAGNRPRRHLDGGAVAVYRSVQEPVHEPVETLFGQSPIVMHVLTLRRISPRRPSDRGRSRPWRPRCTGGVRCVPRSPAPGPGWRAQTGPRPGA